MAKSAIMTTANTKVKAEDRKTQATPFEMGAGEIDPGKVDKARFGVQPGPRLRRRPLRVRGVGRAAPTSASSRPDRAHFSGQASASRPMPAISTWRRSVSPSWRVSQTVTRTVTSVADKTVEYKAKVKAPDGYDVVVSPSRFTIAPGETQVIEITITNTGATARRVALRLARAEGQRLRGPQPDRRQRCVVRRSDRGRRHRR